MVNSAATSMSSSTSPVSDAKITLTPAACTNGLAATEIHCSAKMMSPSPIMMRPKRPTLVDCRARNSVTPTKISSGASHDRSNDRMTVTSDVPTSAPSITASAGAVLIRPWPANAATMSAVAVLLWMSPVTPRPAKKAVKRWLMLLRRIRRRSVPYSRRMPVRTMCVPQTSSETPASRLSSVCMSGAPGRPKRPTAPPRGAASEASVGAVASGAPGRPKRLTAPPRGAASEASVGAVTSGAPGRPKRLTAPPRGAASEASVGVVTSGEGPSRGASCAPSGGSEAAQAASVGAVTSDEGPSRGASSAPSGGSEAAQAASVGAVHHQGNEYVLVLVKLFIASCTPSL